MKRFPYAFHCSETKECIESTECPAWVIMQYKHVHSNEVQTVGECFFQALPKLMLEVARSANRPAAAVESARNEIVRGFQTLAEIMSLPKESLKEFPRKEVSHGLDSQ